MNKFLIYILISLFAITPVLSFAQTQTQLKDPTGPGADKPLITCGNSDNPNDYCDVDDINVLILNILKLIFIFAGFVVAAMFMYAGFLLITAAGNTGQIQKAKDIFKRVVIGFLIMSLSYILVKNLLERINVVEFFKNIIT